MTTDKSLLSCRFSANYPAYNQVAVVQSEICEELSQMLDAHHPEPVEHILEVGAGTGFLTRRLAERFKEAHWTINDLSPQAFPFLQSLTPAASTRYLWGDAEELMLPADQSLIATASSVQWFDDLPRFVVRVREALAPRGYFALTTFGQQNFKQIKACTGVGLEYYTAEILTEILVERGFEILTLNEYVRTLYFDSPREVLQHLKATGVNSIAPTRWTKGDLLAFEKNYSLNFSEPGSGVSLSYHPILLVARLR